MRVIFRLWVVLTALWVGLLSWANQGEPHLPPDVFWKPPAVVLGILLAIAWAFGAFSVRQTYNPGRWSILGYRSRD